MLILPCWSDLGVVCFVSQVVPPEDTPPIPSLCIYPVVDRSQKENQVPLHLALVLSPAGVWSPAFLSRCPAFLSRHPISRYQSLDSGSQAPSHRTTGPALKPAILNVSQWLARENYEHISMQTWSSSQLLALMLLYPTSPSMLAKLKLSQKPTKISCKM